MIKTNLIKRESVKIYHAWKGATPLLAIVLAVQVVLIGIKLNDADSKKKSFNLATQRLNMLQSQAETLKITTNLQDLAGKVAARNNWLADKRKSPLISLAELQKKCPNNVRFTSFSADSSSGRITLAAPDLNAVSSWLNSHFSNKGNISVIGKEDNLLLIQYIWSG